MEIFALKPDHQMVEIKRRAMWRAKLVENHRQTESI
jgi:hypothetical protein